jgi:hypothetical protein
MSDWTSEAADRIDQMVGTVRDRTVVPAETVSRAIVFGTLVAFFAATAAVLLSIMVFRLLALALPIWAAWLVMGGIFVAGGAFCWAMRSRTSKEDPTADV